MALRARAQAIRDTSEGNPAGAFAGRRVVAAVDGGRVQIRRRVAGRPKKGGRKHFVTEWREPRILTLYVLGADGRRDRSVPSVIDGTLGDADAVFDLLRYHLLRMGAHLAEELTLIGDGAEWIWNRAEELRRSVGVAKERFHEILDYFHAVERLGELSKLHIAGDEPGRLSWLHDQKQRLKAGDVAEIEAASRKAEKAAGKEAGSLEGYWSRNRARADRKH